MIQLLLLCINDNNNNYYNTKNTNDSIQQQEQEQQQQHKGHHTSKRKLQGKGDFRKKFDNLYNSNSNNKNKKYYIKRRNSTVAVAVAVVVVCTVVTIWLLVAEDSMTWMIVLLSRQQQRKSIINYNKVISNNNNNKTSTICSRFCLNLSSGNSNFTCTSSGYHRRISNTSIGSTTEINVNSRINRNKNNNFRIVGSVSAFTVQYSSATSFSSNHFVQQLVQQQKQQQQLVRSKNNNNNYNQYHHYSTTSTVRMGIKGFRGWFETQFPTAIISVPISKSITDSAKTKQRQSQYQNQQQQQQQQQNVQHQNVQDKKKQFSSSKTNLSTTTIKEQQQQQQQSQKQQIKTSKTKRQQKHLQSTIGSNYTIRNDSTATTVLKTAPLNSTATAAAATSTATAATTATTATTTTTTILPTQQVNGIRRTDNTNNNNNKEYFDHVLIDVNQLLHQVVRKSRTDGHGIILLMKELDLIVSSLACPIRSLVLAIDGAPSSAKIRTQRLRRYNTVYKSSKKIISYSKHISQTYDTIKLIENQLLSTGNQNQQPNNDQQQQVNGEKRVGDGTETTSSKSVSSKLLMNKHNLKRKLESKKQKEESSFRTLCLTPGTDYMNQIEQAILYWSYQRLSPRRTTSFFTTPPNSNSNMNTNMNGVNSNINDNQAPQIEIFLSSSSVPGEGEVKLLEWIYNHMTPKFTNVRSLYNSNNNNNAANGGRTTRQVPQQHRTNNNKTSTGSSSSNYNNSDSIAILGGDSDLVLEGLIVPIYYTPNIFILLPDENKRYLSVSIWETTKCIQQQILLSIRQQQQKQQQQQNKKSNNRNLITTGSTVTPNSLSLYDIQSLRYDLALLLILNGNDYLPKLRGTSGFQRLYHTYLIEQGKWRTTGSSKSYSSSNGSANYGYIINPVTMEYNIQFCLQYFKHLAKLSSNKFLDSVALSKSDKASMSPLQQLNNYIGTGLVPSPISFKIYYDNDDDDDAQSETTQIDTGIDDNENDIDIDDDIDDGSSKTDGDQIKIQIRLGTSDMDDYYTASIRYPATGKIQLARQKLAQLAIRELINEGGYNNEDDDNDNNDDDEDDITDSDDIVESKKHTMAPMDVGLYLYGLLWNIQTYQDGVCADYGYDYGKRRGPTAHDIVEYFETIQRQQKQKQKSKSENSTSISSSSSNLMTISIDNVASSSSTIRHRIEQRSQQQQQQQTSVQTLFTPPVSAGVSCLAALPKQYKHLVPEPYRYLSDETVESVFKTCLDPIDNAFDIKQFEYLVEEQVRCLRDGSQTKTTTAVEDWHKHDKNDDYWTVLSLSSKSLQNPFIPPKPFSERFNKLPTNDRMSMRRVTVQTEPNERLSRTSTVDSQIDHHLLQWDTLLLRNVDDITQYKTAYEKSNRKKSLPTVTKSVTLSTIIDQSLSESITLQPDTNIIISEVHDDDDIDIVAEKVSSTIVVPQKGNASDALHGTEFLINRMKEYNIIEPSTTIPTTKDSLMAVAVLNLLKEQQLIGNFTWTVEYPSTTEFASYSPNNFTHIILFIQQQQLTSRSVMDKNEMMITKNNNSISSTSSTSLQLEQLMGRTYEQDYLMVKNNKKFTQQYLASVAIQDLLSNVTTKSTGSVKWIDLTFNEIRDALSESTSTKSDSIIVPSSNRRIQQHKQRLELYNIQDFSKIIPTTVDGINAKELLHELSQVKIIDECTWSVQRPSKSPFASYAPDQYDQHYLCIQLGRTFSINNDSNDNNNNNDYDNTAQIRYEVDKLMYYHSKQTVHHYLSSLAIQDLVSKMSTTTNAAALQNGVQVQHWTNLTRDDIVNALLNDKKMKEQEQELLLVEQQQQQQKQLQSKLIQEM